MGCASSVLGTSKKVAPAPATGNNNFAGNRGAAPSASGNTPAAAPGPPSLKNSTRRSSLQRYCTAERLADFVVGGSDGPKFIEPNEGCGHVFLLHCNSAGLAADALLIPLRDNTKVSTDDDNVVSELSPAEIAAAGDYQGVSHVFEGQVTTRLYTDESAAIAGNMAVVLHYLNVAGERLQGTQSGFKRSKPLVALPMPGVGLMDEQDLIEDGNIVRPLLRALYCAASDYEVDIALCTIDREAFNVAQVLREECCPFEGGPWRCLPTHMREEAIRLQAQANSGRLGILFGAGVSFPSGLPSWLGLLKELALRAGFDEESRTELLDLGFLDQPTLIAERMGDLDAFKRAVADCVDRGRYTPAHAIMGAMRLPAVTTNYDPLYEEAVASAALTDEDNVQRLPWDAAKVSNMSSGVRRLLKLHGCVTDPPSIVLTREDYMRYEDTRRALRGLLHQNLLEREFLVLGFSMTDDNVHVIIDQVRKALRGKETRGFKMGTVVTLVENAMFRKLWEKDFEVYACGRSWADDPAWIHDVFLDCICSGLITRSAAASFVLNPVFRSLLSDEQRKIRDALEPLHALMQDEAVRATKAWPRIAALLEEFGAPEFVVRVCESRLAEHAPSVSASSRNLLPPLAPGVAPPAPL